MLGKLYKREFEALSRWLLPMYCSVIGIAIFGFLSFTLSDDSWMIGLAQSSISILYSFSLFALEVLSLAIIVSRFYKNLFTNEGYLTLSLPVTVTQHVMCKLVCATLLMLANVIVSIISICIFMASGIASVSGEIIDIIRLVLAEPNGFLIFIEAAILLLLCVPAGLMVFYTSITLGQMFKNRVGGAVLWYAIFYVIGQVIGTLVLIFAPFFITAQPSIWDFFSTNTITVILGFIILFELIVLIGGFLITKYRITKKLNLE